MHALLSQLYADHYNALRLLRCFESELACIESQEDWHDRLPIILDILEYVRVYPEKFHHPIEDLAFDKLLVKDVPGASTIWGIKAEHVKLEKMTQKAQQLFANVANDVVVSMEELLSTAGEFIARQTDHINCENSMIFPLFEKYLSDEDWSAIQQKIDLKKDPLFEQRVREEYKSLYQAILKAEGGLSEVAMAKPIATKRSAEVV